MNLRKGVKSCAGNTFTADDVIYTFQRAKSVSGAAPVAWFLSNVGGVLGLEPLTSKDPKAKNLNGEVTKIDDYTVQIKQQHPNDLFPRVLEIFALWIYDSKETKAHATAKDPWSHVYVNTVSSPGFGPYCLTKWNKGSETDLAVNPNGWYGGTPQFKKIIIRKVPANSNRVAAIQSGAADIVTNLTPQETANVAKNSGVTVLTNAGPKILTLGMSFNFKPWSDATNRLLRQAVAYALPYDDIYKSDYLGTARKWNGLCADSYYGFVPHAQYVTNIPKAKALMTQAGFTDGKGLETDGLKLTYVAERRALLEPIANRIKTALAQIGINITLDPISQSEYTDRTLTKYDVPMFLADQDRPLGPDIGYCSLLFYVSKKNGGLNVPFAYNNPAFDALYKTTSTTTGATRLAALAKMQNILMTDLPGIPVAQVSTQLTVRKGITGWVATNYDILSFLELKSA
jgi:peptide/nickel transport system substrate-binding protein